MATMCVAPAGNMLAKQRKKEQEESDVFPKLGKITGGTILRHQLDDIYSRSSYSKSYDTTKMSQMNSKGSQNNRPRSGRRNRPHPRKFQKLTNELQIVTDEHTFRKLTMTDDAGLWNWAKGGIDDANRYETEYSRLYAGSPHNTAYSESKSCL
ncbi:hypothetical protein AC249_AIPGENE16610 [Exaiptasia diaphana]|nr:hypothetical protein AC249_AIPGENE16610 [Exaiptasia diaphana]